MRQKIRNEILRREQHNSKTTQKREWRQIKLYVVYVVSHVVSYVVYVVSM